MTESFSTKTLGEIIARTLCLRAGDDVEILRDRLDGNRVMIVRHADSGCSGLLAPTKTKGGEK